MCKPHVNYVPIPIYYVFQILKFMSGLKPIIGMFLKLIGGRMVSIGIVKVLIAFSGLRIVICVAFLFLEEEL